MKKIISMLLVLMLIMGTLTACTKTNQSDETSKGESQAETQKGTNEETNGETSELSGKIIVATNMTNVVDTTLAQLAQDFMDEHPGTVIEYEGIKDYDSTLATRVAGGEAPDLYISIDGMNADNYADYFIPLDDLDIDWDAILFSKSKLGSDGKVYAISDTVSYTGIVYNKAAFKAAGIEKIPTTMEEFYDVCAKLKEAGITPVGTAFKDVWPIYPWVSWDMVQVTLNGNKEGKNVYVNQDKIFDDTMQESMNTLRKLYQLNYLEDDIMSASWDQFKIDISSGKVAMCYMESWFPAQVVEGGANAEDVGMFPYPGAKAVFSVSGKAYGVSKDSKNPELAKAYLKYMIEGGKHAFAVSSLPADTRVENEDPYAAELLSYGVEASDCEIEDAAFTKIRSEIELDEQSFLMTYVMESDDAKAQAMIDEWNAKWAQARPDFVD